MPDNDRDQIDSIDLAGLSAPKGEHMVVIVLFGVDQDQARSRLELMGGVSPCKVAVELPHRAFLVSVVDEHGNHADWEPTGPAVGFARRPHGRT